MNLLQNISTDKKHLLQLGAGLMFSLFIVGCDKPATEPPEVAFGFTATDTLFFEHSGIQSIEVAVECAESKQFGAKLSIDNGAFVAAENEITISSNQTGSFDIELDQNYADPGTYTGDLSVSIYNENSTPKTSKVALVYAPNCAYDFRNHKNGEITFLINGNLMNKIITCGYNESGQLVIDNLTTYQVVLNVTCDAQSVEMVPTTNIGSYMTANGTITGDFIELNMFADGNLHATARIKP